MAGELLLECSNQLGGCWAPVLAMRNAAFYVKLLSRGKGDGNDVQLSVIPANDFYVAVSETIPA
jgi:hypothetical protein